ncbi:MAG: nitroreductase family protein [Firmicutes bacterium]|nr:nitroreductase family protein [Bacillota bacterium]MDD4793584.1 nitroreductase family protein [Bacillota bacterium]
MISGILASAWHEAIPRRHSTRNYDERPVPDELLNGLTPLLSGFAPLCEGARAVIVADGTPKIFTGIIGSFGKITAPPPVALAFVADTSHPHYQVATGYLGEGIILQATYLGLATCWVSGGFSSAEAKSRVELEPSEKVMAMTPLGFAAPDETLGTKGIKAVTSAHKRKHLSSIVSGLPPKDWLPDCGEALEAARIAPSAMNRQPWRFDVDDKGVTISTFGLDLFPRAPVKLDCGIAMLHFEAVARANGLHGQWRMTDGASHVAEFIFADANP